MKGHQKILVAIVLSSALAGCGKEESNNSQNLNGELTTGLVIQNVETSQLEGKIVKVQPSQFSFYGDYFGSQVNSLRIDIETFIDIFMKQKYSTDDNFVIEAEGIITTDGIKYK